MAKFNSIHSCHELIVDGNDNITNEYARYLPHSKDIIQYLCHKWNGMHDTDLLPLINRECDNCIDSCHMNGCELSNGETTVSIIFELKENVRLNSDLKAKIENLMSNMWHDWFAHITKNLKFTDADGTIYKIA